jgi:EAL domain-containing protein (putative c-di-GMP-specific phosphodiesterase class I)
MATNLIPVLFYFFSIFSIAIGISLYWIFKERRDASLYHWMAGTVLSGVSAGITIFRAELPLLLSYVFANALNFIGFLFFAHALRYLFIRPSRYQGTPKWALYVGLIAIYCLVLFALTEQASQVVQTTFVSILAGSGCLYVGYVSRVVYREKKDVQLAVMAWIFLLQALCWFARIVPVVLSASHGAFDPTFVNIGIFTLLLILGLSRHMVYIAARVTLSTREAFDLRKRNRLLENIVLENKLHSALRAKIIVPHYQSIVDLASGKVIGFEALARWHDAELGAVAPDTFIPIIEESGRIKELTDLIVDQIIIDLPTIKKKFPGALVSINVSSLLFADEYLLKLFGQRLVQFKNEYPSLVLEIVEGKIIEANAQVGAQITQLRDWGLGISIDDFGKDYSSHSRLIALPFNHLKIDREFIHQLGKSKNADIVVKNIIDLAQNLGISVTAEGVETQQQRNVLVQLGCHCGQGWYFERDQPLDRLHGLPATFGPPVEAAPEIA